MIINIPDIFGIIEQKSLPESFTDRLISALISALIGGIISGTVFSAALDILFYKRTVTIRQEIRSQFDILCSKRKWKEQSVSELLRPTNILWAD